MKKDEIKVVYACDNCGSENVVKKQSITVNMNTGAVIATERTVREFCLDCFELDMITGFEVRK